MTRTSVRIYTVVDVASGVAVEASSFTRLDLARKYLKKLQRGRNLDVDDVQLFEDAVTVSGKTRAKRQHTNA